MNLKSEIYRSEECTSKTFPSRFKNQARIQNQLEMICNHWAEYLKDYAKRTAKLFGGECEFPWKDTERAIVSTLAASITRNFPRSIILEEAGVPRRQGEGWGRCDLWASIPKSKSKSFNFYLEAKKAVYPKSGLKEYFKGEYGISKIFRDYLKCKKENGQLAQLSPYRNLETRKHEHYIFGMLVTRLSPKEWSYQKEICPALKAAFEHSLKIDVRGKNPIRRSLKRFPTVALVMTNDEAQNCGGVIISLTVLGATKELLQFRPKNVASEK